MTVYGNDLSDLSRNQLAYRLADDARAMNVANQLAQMADRAARERMSNNSLAAENYRWTTPNATSQLEIGSRERMWGMPSGNQLAANEVALKQIAEQRAAEDARRLEQARQFDKQYTAMTPEAARRWDVTEKVGLANGGVNNFGLQRDLATSRQSTANAANAYKALLPGAVADLAAKLDDGGSFDGKNWSGSWGWGMNSDEAQAAAESIVNGTPDPRYLTSSNYRNAMNWWNSVGKRELEKMAMSDMTVSPEYVDRNALAQSLSNRQPPSAPPVPFSGSNTNWIVNGFKVTPVP